MHKYDLVIDKYWVTHSDYFIIVNKVKNSMEITDINIILCMCIKEKKETGKLRQDK